MGVLFDIGKFKNLYKPQPQWLQSFPKSYSLYFTLNQNHVIKNTLIFKFESEHNNVAIFNLFW